MCKLLATLAATILLLTSIPCPLPAQRHSQIKKNCLKKAALKIPRKGRVTVIRNDGSKIQAWLLSIDHNQSLLTTIQVDENNRTQSTYHISEISKIKFHKPGKLKPEIMVVGVVGGAFLGFLIGEELDPPDPSSGCLFGCFEFKFRGGPLGAAIGAGVGLLAGTFIPLIPITHTIKCN